MEQGIGVWLWVVALGLPIVSIMARIVHWLVRRKRRPLVKPAPAELPLRGIRIAAGVLLAYGLWTILRMTSSEPETATASLAFALLLLAAIVASEALAAPAKLDTAARRVAAWSSAIVFTVICTGALGAAFWLHGMPSGEDPIRVAWPMEGRWRVVSGGRNASWGQVPIWTPNAHRAGGGAQSEAVDLVSADSDRPTEGLPVYAPVAGEVIMSIWDDPGSEGLDAGNHVRIRMEDGAVVELAHLAPYTVEAQIGDRVAAGALIGQAGGSGSALIPHLHIHAERDGRPAPLLFGSREKYLARGDVIRGRPAND